MPNTRLWRCAAAVALVVVLAACGAQPSTPPAGPTTTVTDVLGRQVQVSVPAQRILLDGSRLLYTTGLLNKQDPLAHIVGMPNDLEQNDPGSLEQYRKAFPAVDAIPRTGEVYNGAFSMETALRLKPDVFVIGAANFKAAQDAGIVDRLAAAGIPTVVVDYFVDPLQHTEPSVTLLGKLLGRDAEAQTFNAFYRSVLDRVQSRLAAAKQPPTSTFLWRAPGYFECCSSFAKANLGQLVTFAGGHNIADDILPTKQGTVSPETVLTRNPDVLIATGADWTKGTPAGKGFVALGYDESPQKARTELDGIIASQPGFGELKAVRDHRTYAVWHHFYDSPYNFLAVEWFAKWLHPDLFTDVDPDATLRDLHSTFLPFPYSGSFWTSAS